MFSRVCLNGLLVHHTTTGVTCLPTRLWARCALPPGLAQAASRSEVHAWVRAASASPAAAPAVRVASPLLRAGARPGSRSGPEATPRHRHLSAGCPPGRAARTLSGLGTPAPTLKSHRILKSWCVCKLSEELVRVQAPQHLPPEIKTENFLKYQLILK